MQDNVLKRPGKAHMQPCMQCEGIKRAGPLEAGFAICPRCLAEWEGPLPSAAPEASLGCFIMFWAVVAAIALTGAAIIKSCYGRVW